MTELSSVTNQVPRSATELPSFNNQVARSMTELSSVTNQVPRSVTELSSFNNQIATCAALPASATLPDNQQRYPIFYHGGPDHEFPAPLSKPVAEVKGYQSSGQAATASPSSDLGKPGLVSAEPGYPTSL